MASIEVSADIRSRLRQFLTDRFSLSELKDLSFDLKHNGQLLDLKFTYEGVEYHYRDLHQLNDIFHPHLSVIVDGDHTVYSQCDFVNTSYRKRNLKTENGWLLMSTATEPPQSQWYKMVICM